jgi:hypothetical protein
LQIRIIRHLLFEITRPRRMKYITKGEHMITKEQFMEFVGTDEGKAAVGEIAKGLGLGDTTGLVNKNKELLGEIKNLKEKNSEIEQKFTPFKELNPDDVKTALEKMKNPEKDPRLDNLSLEIKQLKGMLDAEKAEKEKANKILEDKEKSDRIRSALEGAGVDKAYFGVLTNQFRDTVILKRDEKGNASIVVDNGTSVTDFADYAKDWSKSDDGKPFMPRPINTGAGARSYVPGSGIKVISEADFNSMNPKAQAKFMSEGGSIQ